MEKYIVIKELPDANVGTEVNWCESEDCFKYKKSAFVSPNDTSYLTAGQVTQTPEFFCKADEYPEYYAYKYPVYNREEILRLTKECFMDKLLAKEIRNFEVKLRELGKTNAKKIIQS